MRGRRLRRAVALPSSTNCYVSPELFPRLARTAIAIAPIAIATAKVVANKTQTIPILPMNAITAIKRKEPAP
jgi:hypothetical protein